MPDVDDFMRAFGEIQEWNKYGQRLMEILAEVKEKIGEAPLCITEEGEAYVHPDLMEKLNEPGNEGAMEFLQYMKQLGPTAFEED